MRRVEQLKKEATSAPVQGDALASGAIGVLIAISVLILAVQGHFLLALVGASENPLRHEFVGGMLLTATFGFPVFASSVALSYFARRRVRRELRVSAYASAVLGVLFVLVALAIGSVPAQ